MKNTLQETAWKTKIAPINKVLYSLKRLIEDNELEPPSDHDIKHKLEHILNEAHDGVTQLQKQVNLEREFFRANCIVEIPKTVTIHLTKDFSAYWINTGTQSSKHKYTVDAGRYIEMLRNPLDAIEVPEIIDNTEAMDLLQDDDELNAKYEVIEYLINKLREVENEVDDE